MASDPKQPDLDAILDAALDELDHDSDNDEPAAPLSPTATTLHSEKAASAPAAPASDNPNKPTYGPQRPPTNLTPQEAELASSLENMMEQFMSFGNIENDEATLQNAERAMEEMFLKMMQQDSSNSGDVVGDSTQSNVAASTAGAAAAGGSDTVKKKDKSNKVQDNTKSRGKKSSVKSSEKKKQSKETNMGETINTLLNNIQQPESTSIAPNMEEFADASISNLLNDISAMTNADDANPLIDTVMKQLLDKELMYQPMKEVCNRFPVWLAKNKETLSHEEYERYGKQYQYFQRIVHVYEVEPGNFERLMELMQDIQEYGQPPVEIIKELAPELQFDDEGMPIMDPMGNGGPMMPPFMPGMPFPGGDGEQCCIS